MTIESCTTRSAKKWHLSDDLQPSHRHPDTPGRSGRTLCGIPGAINQDRLDYDGVRGRAQIPDITDDLPPCEACGRVARSRGITLPDPEATP